MNERLKTVLERTLGEDYMALEKTENFRDADFWDSVRYVNLVVGLQSEFKIQFEKKDIQQLFSVASIKSVLGRYGVNS